MTATIEEARAAKQKLKERFRDEDHITGIGLSPLGTGYAVKVNLLDMTEPGDDLPASIDGVAVLYEVTGEGHPERPA